MITGLNWTIRRPRNATRVRKDANYKYTLRNLWAGRPSLVFFRLVKAHKLLLRWLALQYQALFVVPYFTSEIFVAALWCPLQFLHWRYAYICISPSGSFFHHFSRKRIILRQISCKINDPFWKYQVLIQLQYNNVCKIHLDEPNGPI